MYRLASPLKKHVRFGPRRALLHGTPCAQHDRDVHDNNRDAYHDRDTVAQIASAHSHCRVGCCVPLMSASQHVMLLGSTHLHRDPVLTYSYRQ